MPANHGGCDRFGWDPGAKKPVTDIGDLAAKRFAARRYALRLSPELIRAAAPSGENEDAAAEREKASAFADKLIEVIADWRDRSGRKREIGLVDALLDADPPGHAAEALGSLKSVRRGQLQAVFPYREDEQHRARGVVLLAPKGLQFPVPSAEELAGGTPATEDDWQGSLAGDAQTLAEHSQEVWEFAEGFAERAGLNELTASDLALAAYLHDAGKADPRFQAMLYGGDWFAVNEQKILAKSVPGVGPDAAHRAGLPPRWRHEALSVRIAREHASFQEANDKELVLWLIGVHHGCGRPLSPHSDPWGERDRGDLVNIDGSVRNPLPSFSMAGTGLRGRETTVDGDHRTQLQRATQLGRLTSALPSDRKMLQGDRKLDVDWLGARKPNWEWQYQAHPWTQHDRVGIAPC